MNIAALREHLIDMNEVTLGANADHRALDNGVEIMVTGNGRTLPAITGAGFMGIMLQGAHHQPHHLVMAKAKASIERVRRGVIPTPRLFALRHAPWAAALAKQMIACELRSRTCTR